jgi:gas vesicle protein
MAKKKTKKDELSTEQKWGIGVGLTAAAAAAVGGYFLYGSKDAEKNRAKVKSWMLKAKADVLESLENVKHMSREEYEELVDTVANAYADVQNATKKDLREFKQEMKAHWNAIEKNAKPIKKQAARTVKTTRKTATDAAKNTTTAAKKATRAKGSSSTKAGTKTTPRRTTKS